MAAATDPSDYPELREADAAGLVTPRAMPPAERPAAPGATGVKCKSLVVGEPTYGLILRIAAPAIGEQVLGALIGLTDVVIAGHLPGNADVVSAASAAVGLMTYLQWFAGLMTAAMATGATAIVSRAIGSRKIRVANRVAGTAISAAFIVSVSTSILMFIFAQRIADGCGLTGLAATFAAQYLRIMVVTISLQTSGQIGMAAVRGAGDTVRPMRITLLVMLVNLVTSSVFTFGWLGAPAWGIKGDAFGTMLAYLAGGICTAVVLLGNSTPLRIRLRHLKIVPHVLMRILRIGVPSWLEGILLWGGQFLIVIFVMNVRTDPNGFTLAAHSVVLRIESLSFLPGFGFQIAASALVGQYLGAGKPREAKRAAILANTLGCITMTLLALPMVLAPHFMLSLLVNSPPVVAVGLWPMIIAGLAQPGFAVAIVLSGAIRGAGETVLPMLSTVTGIFIVRLGVLGICLWYMATHQISGANLTAVWIAIFVDLNYRAIFSYVIFHRDKWLSHKV